MKKLLFFAVALILSANLAMAVVNTKAVSGYSSSKEKSKAVLYGYDFEDDAQGWTIMGTEYGWQWGNSESLTDDVGFVEFTGNETNFLGINANFTYEFLDDTAISPELALAAYAGGSLELNYNSFFDGSWGDVGIVRYRISAESEWVELQNAVSSSWENQVVVLPQEALVDGVQIGFCYQGDPSGFGIDDVQITSAADSTPPEFVSLFGNKALTGSDMSLKLTVSDAGSVPATITATYALVDGAPQTITMNLVADKGEFVYVGSIESPVAAAESDIVFHLSDMAGNPTDITKHIMFIAPVEVTTVDDDFEAYDNFLVDPVGDASPWFFLDFDGSATYGIADTEFENEKYTGSFIVFNPSATTPSVFNDMYAAHSGSKYLACKAAETPTKVNNDWLISPKINIDEDYTLDFWAKSHSSGYGLERFKVGISTTGGNPNDFTFIADSNAVGKDYIEAPTEWKNYSFDLSAYEAETHIYFAVNCISEDADMFMIDDIKVKKLGSNGIDDFAAPVNAELYQNYPNPFNPSTTIKFFNNMSGDVKLSVFNVKGELVSTLVNGHMSASYHSVNFDASNLNSGVYYYTLKTPTKSITKKMILVK